MDTSGKPRTPIFILCCSASEQPCSSCYFFPIFESRSEYLCLAGITPNEVGIKKQANDLKRRSSMRRSIRAKWSISTIDVDAELGEQVAADQNWVLEKQFDEDAVRNSFDLFAKYGRVIGRRIANPSLIGRRKRRKGI
jgi:hypothetical protein